MVDLVLVMILRRQGVADHRRGLLSAPYASIDPGVRRREPRFMDLVENGTRGFRNEMRVLVRDHGLNIGSDLLARNIQPGLRRQPQT
jgi:hypothetical protein